MRNYQEKHGLYKKPEIMRKILGFPPYLGFKPHFKSQ